MKGKIRVYCRVRPMNQMEERAGSMSIIELRDQFSLDIWDRNQRKDFHYDGVYGESASQEEIFEDTKMLLQSAIDGYNVCIFAYGQTGSGKTYTILGTQEQPGLVPRAFKELIALKEKKKQ